MKITFAPEAQQDWDGLVRVFENGLVGSTVEVKYKPGRAPLYDGNPITDYHPQCCDIVAVLGGSEPGLDLSYDDGSHQVFVPFDDIEEVTYL